MFFKYLKVKEKLDLSPQGFLDLLAVKRAKVESSERCWGKNLVQRFSRDNPDLQGKSDGYILSNFAAPIVSFCRDNEVELASEKSAFGGRVRRKFEEPAFTVTLAKKVMALLNQRDRAICMTMLQSGQSIKQVLNDVNGMKDYIFREMDAGKQRIRLDFKERKGNGFHYFSFISVDTISEMRKWRVTRQQWLGKLGIESDELFITSKGKPVETRRFHTHFKELMRRHGIWTGPFSVRLHMFRKIFESEASPPDRGISKAYITFMMGHSGGNGVVSKLDMPGGTYDNAPRIYVEAMEKEYCKLEPYINIFTGKTVELAMSDMEREVLELLSNREMFDRLKAFLESPKELIGQK
jgi:hypothetical protein